MFARVLKPKVRSLFVQSVVLIIIGAILIGWSQSIHIPSAYNTFLGIPYDVNPTFESSLYEILALVVFGVLFLGFGLGELAITPYVYLLEKRLFQIPPPPFNPSFRKTASFCRYCGTQNTPDAVFCSKCGEKLT